MQRHSPPDNAQKKFRRGTKSCRPCRQRKIRCSGTGNSGGPCYECRTRGDSCLPQGIVSEDGPGVTRRLKERIASLEAQLEQFTGENQQSYAAPCSKREEPVTGSTSLLSGLKDDTNARNETGDEPEQPGEDEDPVNTYSAPLMQLMRNSLLSASPDSSETHGDENWHRKWRSNRRKQSFSAKDSAAVKGLSDCLPSEAKMIDILENDSHWWNLYRNTLCLVWGDADRTPKEFAMQALSSGDPCLLALLLVLFAISTGDIKTYLPPVEHYVLNDDEYSSTEYGFNCLMALGLCYLNALQPRRGWVVFRRANTLLILNGLHNRKRTEKQENVFWQLWHADRWASLVVGMPYSTPDHSCNIEIAPMEEITPGTWLYRKLGVLTGRVIECLGNIHGPTLSSVLLVEEQLDEVRSQLPPGYLNLESARQCTDLTEKFTRLYRLVHFYQLRGYVHLPFLLRSASEDRYEFSRKSCIDDSRRLLEAFLEIFDTDHAMASSGMVLNMIAFTAAVIVLLGLIGYGKPKESDSASQASTEYDWNLIQRVIDAIKTGAKSKVSSLLCQKCHAALESLVSSALASDNQSTRRVVLPYFGTLLITRRHPSSPQETHKAPQNRHIPPIRQEVPRAQEQPVPTLSSDQLLGGLDTDMSFAYDGPFMPPLDCMLPNEADWHLPSDGWYGHNSTSLTPEEWGWLNATDLPPNTGL